MVKDIQTLINLRAAAKKVEENPEFDIAGFWGDWQFSLMSEEELKATHPLYNPEDWEWFYQFTEEDYEALEAYEEAQKIQT